MDFDGENLNFPNGMHSKAFLLIFRGFRVGLNRERKKNPWNFHISQ